MKATSIKYIIVQNEISHKTVKLISTFLYPLEQLFQKIVKKNLHLFKSNLKGFCKKRNEQKAMKQIKIYIPKGHYFGFQQLCPNAHFKCYKFRTHVLGFIKHIRFHMFLFPALLFVSLLRAYFMSDLYMLYEVLSKKWNPKICTDRGIFFHNLSFYILVLKFIE